VRSWSGLFGGLAMIALVDGVILGGVAWNRSGAPEARIELTERELEPARGWDPEEDSGLSLRLRLCDCKGDWLDREKLRELGFDVRVDPAEPRSVELYENVLAREAFIVLQMDGDAWRRQIAEQEREFQEMKTPETDRWEIDRAREMLETARRMGSRLVPIDAGLDPERLRGRYPDRSRYLILPARFGLWHEPGEKDHPARLTGVVQSLLVEEVHAPLELRPLLDEVRRRREPERRREMQGMDVVQTPLYRATITVGRRHEPRLVSVEPIAP
jgi:hypothetical protein